MKEYAFDKHDIEYYIMEHPKEKVRFKKGYNSIRIWLNGNEILDTDNLEFIVYTDDEPTTTKKYHVTYYYLATGMEGHADTQDFGIIEANSELEALEYVCQHLDKKRLTYSLETDRTYRYWGLSAKEIK